MACLGDKRVHPTTDNSFVRKNGWMLPLHGLQVTSWIVLLFIGFMFFGVVALSVEAKFKPATFICIGFFYICHIICCVVATTINPAESNSIKRLLNREQRIPVFDRKKHKHVIEYGYCNICEVNIDSQSRHCRACNKCVAIFDHHCKWLNNCVGKKNYRSFLLTLLSAIVGCVGIFAVSLLVFIETIKDFNRLNINIWWRSTSSLQLAFQVLIGLKLCVLIIAIALLLQLFVFHMSLIKKGITTYDYLMRFQNKQRDTEQESLNNNSAELDSGAVCNILPEVEETPWYNDNPLVIETGHQKEKDALPKHPLIKSHESGSQSLKYKGIGDVSLKNENFNNNASVSHHNDLSSGNVYIFTTQPKPSAQSPSTPCNVGEPSSPQLTRVLPNSIQETLGIVHTMPQKQRKRREGQKKSLSTASFSETPLKPLPVFTVIGSPSSTSLDSLGNSNLPPVRDAADWMSNSEDLAKGAMKSRKLPPLSTSSSMPSISK